MDDSQLQRDVVMMRIASALERIANHYDREMAQKEAERINYERWLIETARAHLSATVQEDALPVDGEVQN